MIVVSAFWTRICSFGKAQAIVIFPFIFLAHPQLRQNTALIQHENIHWKQILELGILFFYIWYVLEFIVRYFQWRNWDQAYRAISFEKEAYTHEKTPNYLVQRKNWAFFKYVKT